MIEIPIAEVFRLSYIIERGRLNICIGYRINDDISMIETCIIQVVGFRGIGGYSPIYALRTTATM